MCIQWTHVIYSVVITQQSNPPISQFSRVSGECLVNVPNAIKVVNGKDEVTGTTANECMDR